MALLRREGGERKKVENGEGDETSLRKSGLN